MEEQETMILAVPLRAMAIVGGKLEQPRENWSIFFSTMRLSSSVHKLTTYKCLLKKPTSILIFKVFGTNVYNTII